MMITDRGYVLLRNREEKYLAGINKSTYGNITYNSIKPQMIYLNTSNLIKSYLLTLILINCLIIYLHCTCDKGL